MCVTPALLQEAIFSHPSILSFNSYSRAVFEKLKHCHTAHIGMHRFQCNEPDCNHIHWQYHSCGNRHCPNCGSWKKEEWVEFKMADLLPTSYYHVVFTLPHELNPLIMGHRPVLFKLLFQAASHTLLTLAKDDKHLGAEIGITSILHTWGQDLSFHPHVHCIVSGGGVSNGNWVPEKRKNNKFLFPKNMMQKIFKGFFMQHLRKLHKMNSLSIDKPAFEQMLQTIGYKKWNVYAKAPFGGPQQVVEYLGRYTHKVAITPHRVLAVTENTITFRYKDYHDGNKVKEMTLTSQEFLRRFEQHILPKGFVKIRSYGFLKNYNKRVRLGELRKKMNLPPAPPKVRIPVHQRMLEKYGKDITRCPKCQKGTMVLMETTRPYYDYRIGKISGRGREAVLNKNLSP
jgi:hypothetical protein